MNDAIQHGDVSRVKHLVQTRHIKVSNDDVNLACQLGHVDLVSYLFGLSNAWSIDFSKLIFWKRKKVLDYLLHNQLHCVTPNVIEVASAYGRYEMVRSLHVHFPLPTSSLYDAVHHNNLAWLTYLHVQEFSLCPNASRDNHLAYFRALSARNTAIVIFLHRYGRFVDFVNELNGTSMNLVEIVAHYKWLPVLSFFVKEDMISLDVSALHHAIESDYLDMVLFLQKNNVCFTYNLIQYAAFLDSIDVFESAFQSCTWYDLQTWFQEAIRGASKNVFDFLLHYVETNSIKVDFDLLVVYTAYPFEFASTCYQKYMFQSLLSQWFYMDRITPYILFWNMACISFCQERFDVLRWAHEIIDFSCWAQRDGFDDLHPELKALVRLKHNMHTWKSTVQWMNRVRPYAWHWFQTYHEMSCAPNGKGRKDDKHAFECDFIL